MKIQTLSQKTGVSKRNIHYYIKENLIQPMTNPSNGYYDFSEEDCQRLHLVTVLRSHGFSIAVIRAILQSPATSEYYIRMRLEKIRQEITQLNKTKDNLENILDFLPANPSFSDIHEQIYQNNKPDSEDKPLPYDGYLVNHFLWRTYWDTEELTEYQEFLWKKIQKMTEYRSSNEHYAKLYDYLSSQNHKKIVSLYQERNQHINRVANLANEEIISYAEEMKRTIHTFISSPSAVAQWKEHYRDFINPQMHIFTGKIGELAEEMSPFLGKYKSNSSKACQIVYDWMNTEDGEILKQKVLTTLNGYVNLDFYNHAELESMNPVFKY